MKNRIVFLLLLVSVSSYAQNNIVKEKWHRENPLKQDTTLGYALVVKTDNVLYISGVVTNELTPEGVTTVYRNLEKALNSYGATFQNVVKENLYTTDMEAMKKLNETRKSFYKKDFPAATWVQISRLYRPEAKLEVELIAHLPK